VGKSRSRGQTIGPGDVRIFDIGCNVTLGFVNPLKAVANPHNAFGQGQPYAKGRSHAHDRAVTDRIAKMLRRVLASGNPAQPKSSKFKCRSELKSQARHLARASDLVQVALQLGHAQGGPV